MIRSELESQEPLKSPKPLGSILDGTLLAYTSAAVAAGVGILTMAHPAEAKIIYKPANIAISLGTLPFDANGDGTVDFTFEDKSWATSFGGGGTLSIAPAGANKIWGHTRFGRGSASALFAGVRVGPSQHFSGGTRFMAMSATNQGAHAAVTSGPWVNVTNRYLGLKFTIKGKTHYGWARLNISAFNLSVSGTITGYAYETVPGKAIVTGRKKGADEINHVNGSSRDATLGHLAQGARGLENWRSR